MEEKTTRALSSLRETISLVWSNASNFVRFRLAASLLLLVITSILTTLGPLALKSVVDALNAPDNGVQTPIILLVTLYVLSQWLARSIGELKSLIYAYAERRMFRTISERLFGHIMQLPLRFHLERQTGGISQALQNGLQGYQLVVHQLLFTFLPVIAEFSTIFIVLSTLDQPMFFAFFAGACVVYATVFTVTSQRVSRIAQSASERSIDASAIMTDSILNYETVKYFTAEDVVQRRLSRALMATEREWLSFYRLYSVGGIAVATTYAAFLALTVLYAAYQVQAGAMTIGGFLLVNSYMLQVVGPIESIGYSVQSFSQGLAMLDNMLKLLKEKPETTHSVTTVTAKCPGSLEFKSVGVSYNSERSILNDVNFRIPAGKTLGIVGASGAGKSTIVRLVTRLLEADTGRIYLDEVPFGELSATVIRQSIAVVPQDTLLFYDTIGYNIGFGKKEATQEEIEQAAKIANLHDFIMTLPDGYNTQVGERGVKLSGGEKQRVSIARAALKHPRIYVFDEATSSLDSKTEREILRNLREISSACTTLVIAHRLSTVVHADEIVVLEGGTIVERGNHESLLKQDGRYAALWHVQQNTPGHVQHLQPPTTMAPDPHRVSDSPVPIGTK
jgi:ABC-type transport system involved in Fe-S cluster assembly fused permease/ATPase subunit